MANGRRKVVKTTHDITVNGREVQLRVFVPTGCTDPPRPAVVMVCGLLWLGGGLLGRIGITFNDSFGYIFAGSGSPCVQIHTPGRHMADTGILDLTAVLATPLGALSHWVAGPLLVADLLLLATSAKDLALLALLFLPLLPKLPLAAALPTGHALMRVVQYLRGRLPGPSPRCHQSEIAAATAWASSRHNELGSDGRLVMCGYSSGGHCASLFALSPSAPRFEAVVLISGIYGLQTDAWEGVIRRGLAPVFNRLFADILGVRTAEARSKASPEAVVSASKIGKGHTWYVLSARMELMGLEPFQDILFRVGPLCSALEAKGVKVHRVTCGLNHWLLAMNIGDFIGPFCAGLGDK
eukprot:TRINITY_DN40961_c0_g1_i1.p1 TRINITY_DN40961_c0_g1~~TRINITY_DN40961_c0_g1_i1.p1  ORF type:complete len:375 (+),score=47.01 TRINITY_DN40961_c0_g1_i1:69-1127(+)